MTVASPARLLRRPRLTLVLLAAVMVVVAVVMNGREMLEVAQSTADWLRERGVWGALLLVGLYILACLIAVPSSITTLWAGYAFGPIIGFVTASLGSLLGASLAFWIGRTIARERVARWVMKHPHLLAVDMAVGTGLRTVFLTRLSPLFPFGMLNYGYAVTRLPFRDFLLGSWLGMIPRTMLYAYLGSALQNLTESDPWGQTDSTAKQLYFWSGLLIALVVAVVITRSAQAALREILADSAQTAAALRETNASQSSEGHADG